jgi:AcrR family transcriptional regulator
MPVPQQFHPTSEVALDHKGRDDVRARLLHAALEVLLSQGILALTQSRVAREAGLRQSHLTYYFPTRSALLTAVVEAGSQAAVCAMGPDDEHLPPSLNEYLYCMADQIADTRMPRLMTALTLASEEDPSLKTWMLDFKNGLIERMRQTMAHYGVMLTKDQMALFHAQVVGLSVLNLSLSSPESAREARRLFLLASDRLIRDANPSSESQVVNCLSPAQCLKGPDDPHPSAVADPSQRTGVISI